MAVTDTPDTDHRLHGSFKLPACLALFLFSAVLTGCLDGSSQSFKASGLPDLRVAAVEVSQGTQDIANNMPLVAGRATVVRIMPEEINDAEVFDVSVRLDVYRICPGPGCPLDQITLDPDTEFSHPLGSLWNHPAEALYVPAGAFNRWNAFTFQLPAAWRNEPGRLKLVAVINPDDGNDLEQVKEFRYDNNQYQLTVRLHDTRSLRLRAVPVHLHGPEEEEFLYTCDDLPFWPAMKNLYRYHPIARLWVSCGGAALFPPGHDTDMTEWDMRQSEDCIEVLARLQWLRSQESLGSHWHYLGMVRSPYASSLCNGWAGAAGGQRVSWVRFGSDSSGLILAHEIAHNRGASHVLCKGNEGPPNGTVDADYPYPYPDCRFSADDDRGFYGLDVYHYLFQGTKYVPPEFLSNSSDDEGNARLFPLMGYKSPTWTDPYTYCKLLDTYVTTPGFFCDPLAIDSPALHPAPTATGIASSRASNTTTSALPLGGAAQYLLVSGVVNIDNGQGRIDATALLPPERVFPHVLAEARERMARLRPDDSTRRVFLRLLNDDGTEVNRLPVTVEHINHPAADGDGANIYPFLELLAFPPGASRVELVDEDNGLLTARDRSPTAPTIEAVTPSRGSELTEETRITWRASDADGDPLTYLIRYSPDDGTSWHVLTLETDSQAFALDADLLAGLPGSTEGTLEIVANDGFNTAATRIEGLQLANHPPRIDILAPEEGDRFETEDILLSAQVQDLEDGLLPANRITWFSDQGGRLGEGPELALDPAELGPGQHHITVRATDSEDQAVSRDVNIEIIARR